MTDCAGCRARFEGSEFDEELGLKLSSEFSGGACEACSVGVGTCGRVLQSESLLRILVDPRDIDDGKITEAPFRAAFKNGLSVLRSTATDQDCLDQTQEGMYKKHPDDVSRLVAFICEAAVDVVRSHAGDQGRSFFVYDQTVSRRHTNGDPIAGHAGVFGHVLPKGTQGKKIYEKDLAGELKRIFAGNSIPATSFRSGLLIQLNSRSIKGEFILAGEGQQA